MRARLYFVMLWTSAFACGATILEPGTYRKSELPRRSSDRWVCLVEKPRPALVSCDVQVSKAANDAASLTLSPTVPALALLRGVRGLNLGPLVFRAAPKLPENFVRYGEPTVVLSGDYNGDGVTDALVDIRSPFSTATLQLLLSKDGELKPLEPPGFVEFSNETPETRWAITFRDGFILPPLPPRESTDEATYHAAVAKVRPVATGIGSARRGLDSTEYNFDWIPTGPVSKPRDFETFLMAGGAHPSALIIEQGSVSPQDCALDTSDAECEKRLKPRATMGIFVHHPNGTTHMKQLRKSVRLFPEACGTDGREYQIVVETAQLPPDFFALSRDGKATLKKRLRLPVESWTREMPARYPPDLIRAVGPAWHKARFAYPVGKGKFPFVVEVDLPIWVDRAVAPQDEMTRLEFQTMQFFATEKFFFRGQGRALIDVDEDGHWDWWDGIDHIYFVDEDGFSELRGPTSVDDTSC